MSIAGSTHGKTPPWHRGEKLWEKIVQQACREEKGGEKPGAGKREEVGGTEGGASVNSELSANQTRGVWTSPVLGTNSVKLPRKSIIKKNRQEGQTNRAWDGR